MTEEAITEGAMTEEWRETLSAVGRFLGSRGSERKAMAARLNGKSGGRPPRPLEQLPCRCAGLAQHLATCPRGRAIRRRGLQTAARPGQSAATVRHTD